jgi:putative transposase
VDETTLTLHPPLRACWMKRGEQKRIPTPGQQQAHHVLGAYDWAQQTVTWTTSQRKDSEAFIAFLEHLLVHTYPDDQVVLVLYNASIHRSAASQAALSLFEQRVTVFWLPPYCSTLNLIERFWLHLKTQVCVNTLYPNLDELVHAVTAQLQAQNDPTRSNRLTFSRLIS